MRSLTPQQATGNALAVAVQPPARSLMDEAFSLINETDGAPNVPDLNRNRECIHLPQETAAGHKPFSSPLFLLIC